MRRKKPIGVYIKINNGMNRLGFSPNRISAVWQTLKTLPAVGETTLMSHFARADEGPAFIREPLQRLEQATGMLQAPRCYANSAASLWHPETHHQWIRPGVVLYSASPTSCAEDIAPFDLRPAMTLSSEIIAVQQVAAGEGWLWAPLHDDGIPAHRNRCMWLCGWLSSACTFRHTRLGRG